jgi:protein-S-isoprenylcysteine O-methyltransferase Ste14
LLFALFVAVNLHLQIANEERYMYRAYGYCYGDYCAATSRYLPVAAWFLFPLRMRNNLRKVPR